MKAIVGYTGFVGSNLLSSFKFDKFYNSKNFENAIGCDFDELFFVGLPAEKWKINKYPDIDDYNINKIKNILNTISVKRFILISTIDVYENVNNEYDEDYDPNFTINHKYGTNRYLFENYIKNKFPNYHIIRLPAIFGLGIKKNIIYDLINNNQIENIPLNSKFQWYSLTWIKDDIRDIINKNIKLINLFPEPLETQKIINLFRYEPNKFTNDKVIFYNTRSKYFLTGYNKTNEESLEEIKKFIDFSKINKQRLRVSNIFPKEISQFQFANILKLFGIEQIQIAPTILNSGSWNITNIDYSILNGLKITSMQSILYGINNNIFKNPNVIMEHIKMIIEHSNKNRINALIFGCP